MSEPLKLNQDQLTIGDLEDFEEVVGMSFDEALGERPVLGPDGKVLKDETGRPIKEPQITAKALKALVWIVKRQEDPKYTLNDARNIKMVDLQLTSGDDDVDPKEDGAS